MNITLPHLSGRLFDVSIDAFDKHRAAIMAFCAGKTIQFRQSPGGAWQVTPWPMWNPDTEYRVMPEPVLRINTDAGCRQWQCGTSTFDRMEIKPLGDVLCFSINHELSVHLSPEDVQDLAAYLADATIMRVEE